MSSLPLSLRSLTLPAPAPAPSPARHPAPVVLRIPLLHSLDTCDWCGGAVRDGGLVAVDEASYSASGMDVTGLYCSPYCLDCGVAS